MNDTNPDNLYTERLQLRQMNPVMNELVMTTYDDSAVMAYFGFTTQMELTHEKERFRQGMTMAGRSFRYFHLVERNTGEVMGWCGYHTWFTQHRRAELGYVLNGEKYKRKGYMSEALPPVIKYGFENMNLHRIEALIAPDNVPSLKLIERLGFNKEGTLRAHYLKNNRLEDSVMYALLQPEFVGDNNIESK